MSAVREVNVIIRGLLDRIGEGREEFVLVFPSAARRLQELFEECPPEVAEKNRMVLARVGGRFGFSGSGERLIPVDRALLDATLDSLPPGVEMTPELFEASARIYRSMLRGDNDEQ